MDVATATARVSELTAAALALGPAADPDDFLAQFMAAPSDEQTRAWDAVAAAERDLEVARLVERAALPTEHKYKPCPRCAGRGLISSYMHIAHGKCFRCDGAAVVRQD